MAVDCNKFLVVDFEFTMHEKACGRPRAFFPEIIEVGAVEVASPDYQIQHSYQSFVKPTFFPRLTEECRNFTMINQEDVDGGISFQEMLQQLAKHYVPGETYLAAWGNADWDVLSYACQRYKLACPFQQEDYIDLAEEYKIYHNLDRHKSLKNAVEELQLVNEGLYHCALDDAQNAAKVLNKMLVEGWTPSADKAQVVAGN